MVFVETHVFTRQIKGLMSDEEYRAVQRRLLVDPVAGQLIADSGGLRKLRVPASGRGRRGGARVIYYHFGARRQIAMLLAHAKNEQDDLSREQLRALTRIVEKW